MLAFRLDVYAGNFELAMLSQEASIVLDPDHSANLSHDQDPEDYEL